MRHELKTWPVYFSAIFDGRKTFEVRRNDRPSGFKEGDVLALREWCPNAGEYSGRAMNVRVSYVFRGAPVADGFCVMAIKKILGEGRA